MRLRLPLLLTIFCAAATCANKIPVGKLLNQMIQRSTLAEPGGRPFYLKATISDREDSKSEFNGTVEEYWVSATKWRRVIKLRDFSQTRVVNGDAIYEENKGDYFPLHDEMLADEIVDPLPRSAVDLIKSLGMTATEPGVVEGQCMAEKYFNDTAGQQTRILLAYNCKSGLLIYLWSPSCCYGLMTDYRKFHNKQVAYATKDELINIRVDTLRDLDHPDEALFAVAQSTPLNQRVTTKKLPEADARKLIVQKTEIKWPTVAKKPRESSMGVDVIIGRDGKVKESHTYSPIENSIEDAALTAINQWTFTPQTVDGIPAQIETTFTIPFTSDLKIAGATPQPEVRPVFDHMRSVGGLRLEGGSSFHLRASFRSEDSSIQGTYEESWASPNKWRREVKLKDETVLEVRTENAFYRTFSGKYAPRVADDIVDAISFSLPGDNGADSHDPDWNVANATLGTLPVLKLSKGPVTADGKPEPFTDQYYVEEKTGYLRGRHHYSSLTVFNALQPFGNKTVARRLTMLGGDVNKLDIVVEVLESISNVDESTFQMPGVKPLFTSADDAERFTPPHPIYSVKPSVHGFHSPVICQVKIDEHGHVRDVEVKGTADEAIVKPIRAALMNWEYEPATRNGHPMLGFVQVNVE